MSLKLRILNNLVSIRRLEMLSSFRPFLPFNIAFFYLIKSLTSFLLFLVDEYEITSAMMCKLIGSS